MYKKTDKDQIQTYVVFHKPEKNRSGMDKLSYLIPIQAGAAKNNKFLNITDNTGENISGKNDHFSELTVLFWLWKNISTPYIGICHYRRILDINQKKAISLLEKKKIILPKKQVLAYSIEDDYKKVHLTEPWNVMCEILKTNFPAYAKTGMLVFQQNKIYPFNIFIGNLHFLHSYCEWLFPILFEVDQHIDSSNFDNYQYRYPGFLAERLLNLYITHHHLNIYEAKILKTPIFQSNYRYMIHPITNQIKYLFNKNRISSVPMPKERENKQ